MVSMRYVPESDTLVIRLDELSAPRSYVSMGPDVVVGIDVAGSIVEIRIRSASRNGLQRVAEILRRRRRRIA